MYSGKQVQLLQLLTIEIKYVEDFPKRILDRQRILQHISVKTTTNPVPGPLFISPFFCPLRDDAVNENPAAEKS